MSNYLHKSIAQIGSLDERLIDLLSHDATRSSEAVAKELHLSSATIRRRVNNLLKLGVIRIVAILELSKLGVPLRVIIAFNVVHEKLNSIMKEVSSHPRLRSLAATTGRFDLIATMWFAHAEELYEFLESEVARIEGIRSTETFVCVHMIRRF